MVDPTEKALDLVFDEVFDLIKDAIRTIYLFKSRFRELETTFQQIEPTIKQIIKLSEELDRPKTELSRISELIEKGEALVNKCSKVGRLDFYHRFVYSRKLNEWDEDLSRCFKINLQSITTRDSAEALVLLKRLLGEQAIRGGVVTSGSGGGYYRKYAVPKAPEFVVGMDEQKKEVRSRLLQGGVSVVVVSGPGGCGKTTLVEQIYNDPDIKGKFKKNAFYFKVSGSFDAVGIIQEMLHIKGSDALHIHTEDDAFRELEKLLQEIGGNPILLVLDDIWSNINLSGSNKSESESLLEKFFLDKILDYKILVTSRFEFPRFGQSVHLGTLKDQDAVKVFLHAATPHGESNYQPDEDLINKIVEQCKGSPLALTVIGKSLCGRRKEIWESRLHRLSNNGALNLDQDRKILICLSRSLDDLSSIPETKECFFDLASFPEDHKIPVCTLIDIWTELYNLDAEVEAKALLRELSDRSLLDLGYDGDGDDDWCEEHFAMQHDLLRQLAVHHSSEDPIQERRRLVLHLRGNAFPDWWIRQKEKPINARMLSISTDNKFSHGWLDMEVPTVEVVVLNFRTEKYILPVFMRKMTKLKALIVANNSFQSAELTNFSLLASLSSLKRIRFERIKIPFLEVTNMRLDNLEKLTLFMCEISKDVSAADDWKGVELPKLSKVNIVYCKNLVKLPAALCDATSLRELSIANCPYLEELPPSIENLLNLEILRLNGCTNLTELPESICRLRSLTLLNISDCISIEELPDRIGELQNLRRFYMKGMPKLSKLPRSIKNLHNLQRVTCDKGRETMWHPLKQYSADLRVQVIEEEPSLHWLRR